MLATADQKTNEPPFIDRTAFLDAISKTLGIKNSLVLNMAAYVYSTEEQVYA